MKTPMNKNGIEQPRRRADKQVAGLDDVRTIQLRRVDCCLMNKSVQRALEYIFTGSTGIVHGAMK